VHEYGQDEGKLTFTCLSNWTKEWWLLQM